jgi:hypothetical protein
MRQARALPFAFESSNRRPLFAPNHSIVRLCARSIGWGNHAIAIVSSLWIAALTHRALLIDWDAIGFVPFWCA